MMASLSSCKSEPKREAARTCPKARERLGVVYDPWQKPKHLAFRY